MGDELNTPTEVIDDIPSIDDSAKLFNQSVAENKPISELEKAAPKSDATPKSDKPADKPAPKAADKPVEKPADKPKDPTLSKFLKKEEPKPADKPVEKPVEEKPIDWKSAPKEFRDRHEKLLTEHKTASQKLSEYEKRVSDYETKIKDIEAKSGDTSKADQKLVEEYTAKINALEERIRGLDYSQSQEYQNLHSEYQEKYQQRYIQAHHELKDFQVAAAKDADGNVTERRPFTEGDLKVLLSKPLAEQRRITRELFGSDADVANSHLDAMRGIANDANFTLSKKLEDARKNGETQSKEQRLAQQKQADEYKGFVKQYRDQILEEYPDVYGEPKDDPEGSKAYKEGHEFVEAVMGNLSNYTPQERAAANALLQARASVVPHLEHRLSKLQAAHDSLLKELEGFRNSDPGKAGSKPSGGSTPAPEGDDDVPGISEMAAKFNSK